MKMNYTTRRQRSRLNQPLYQTNQMSDEVRTSNGVEVFSQSSSP
jgi:hypothetical protein